jgi:hypothetical protein
VGEKGKRTMGSLSNVPDQDLLGHTSVEERRALIERIAASSVVSIILCKRSGDCFVVG